MSSSGDGSEGGSTTGITYSLLEFIPKLFLGEAFTSKVPAQFLVAISSIVLFQVFLIIKVSITKILSIAREKSYDQGFKETSSNATSELNAIKDAKDSDQIWELGISSYAVSINQGGVLRAWAAYTHPPTAVDVVSVLSTSIQFPINTKATKSIKPKILATLESNTANEATILDIKKSLEKFNIQLKNKSDLSVSEKKNNELSSTESDPNEVGIPDSLKFLRINKIKSKVSDEFVEAPPKQCFFCHKSIKLTVCSRCTAVSFCANCLKDKAEEHKDMCGTFASLMAKYKRIPVHKFPFSYYKENKPLDDFNIYSFLHKNGVYGKGLWKVYTKKVLNRPFGLSTVELIAELQSKGITTDKERFSLYDLPEDLFPLSEPIKSDISKINSWEDYWKVRGLSASNPSAILLEVPLTIFHAIKTFVLPLKPRFNKNGQREITVHLLGAEKEADIVLLFEMLLPLFPKTALTIHMISPNIGKFPQPLSTFFNINSKVESTMLTTFRSGVYSDAFYDGSLYRKEKLTQGIETKPDLVLMLNAHLPFEQLWAPALDVFFRNKQATVITEPFELNVGLALGRLRQLNCKFHAFSDGSPLQINPFRQPVLRFSPDTNFPGWSNGFLFKIF